MSKPIVEVNVRHLTQKCFKANGAHLGIEFDCAQTSPKEMFLTGLLGCSAYDMLELSSTRGIALNGLSLSVKAYPSGESPARFERLEILYSFDSAASDEEALSWVEASTEQYCTTINTVRKGCTMSYSVRHNGAIIQPPKELA